jgi:malic enzyme
VCCRCTQGRAIFASGSPFDDVTLEDGTYCKSNQANNMFIFPGLGLGAVLGRCKTISDSMILTASEALAASLSDEEVKHGMVYPDVDKIRKVRMRASLRNEQGSS